VQLRLEIENGPLAGQKISVAEGQTVTIGRTRRSDFAISHDTFLSGQHFALSCSPTACRLVDHHSANGTFVNGARVTDTEVRDGDEVAAGSTKFKVFAESVAAEAVSPPPREIQPAESTTQQPSEAEPATPVPSALGVRQGTTIGSWTFRLIPDGWEAIEAYGIRSSIKGAFPTEAMVTDDRMANGATFGQFVESQLSLVREFVANPQIEKTGPVSIEGANEVETFLVRYGTDDGRRFVQRQIYARAGERVGVVTLTTLESEWAKVRPVLDTIASSLVLHSGRAD
jgi:pSer/pThr/pTyr-binding forkhead associated (FHA) protein